jgi:hypothetical protein
MRFATPSAAYYCGIDLHARTMYLVVLDRVQLPIGGGILLFRR